MMAKKILITFKEDEDWLFDEICRHSSKGGWVKDILKEYLDGNDVKKEIEPSNSNGGFFGLLG